MEHCKSLDMSVHSGVESCGSSRRLSFELEELQKLLKSLEEMEEQLDSNSPTSQRYRNEFLKAREKEHNQINDASGNSIQCKKHAKHVNHENQLHRDTVSSQGNENRILKPLQLFKQSNSTTRFERAVVVPVRKEARADTTNQFFLPDKRLERLQLKVSNASFSPSSMEHTDVTMEGGKKVSNTVPFENLHKNTLDGGLNKQILMVRICL